MLTGKQKRFLRSKANKYKANFQIGKEGVSRQQVFAILDYLEKHELMKVSVLKNCLEDINDIATEIEKYNIEVVQVIGRVLVLYKESNEHKTIELP